MKLRMVQTIPAVYAFEAFWHLPQSSLQSCNPAILYNALANALHSVMQLRSDIA